MATRLQVDTLKDVVVIPEAAIQKGPSGFFAYVVEDGKAHIAQLDIVARDSGLAALKGGIEPGAIVITSGFYRLQPGALVEVRKP